MQVLTLNNDSLWFKDAIIYEVSIRAFADSNGDGVGDFPGLTKKLDYLQDLGVTAIWLLPFFPSPQKDDGYDISDYYSVNPIYGTLGDFKTFLEAAHQRGIRVIIELVVNHTSDQHPWFQAARTAPEGSQERDFYVWSDSPEKYQETRIIFQDFEPSNWSWDAVAGAYYWHRFYHHQPDLNFESAQVRQAIFDIADFWLEMGVDGLRLDAVPYLYEQEGTNCENLPQTHAFLKQLRRHIDENYPNRMLLAEANQQPEDAAAYYGQGDECHMTFHFPLMPRLFMALQLEDSFPIVDILQQTPQIPENCQWALFLRNHDELTLEMVSDQDREYMYRVYAQDTEARINLGICRRLAPLMANNQNQIKLMNCLLLSMPGTPVLYYGDEIGMGDNLNACDRNGVRTPMQWNTGPNAGFSSADPEQLHLPVIIDPVYHFEAINVETQQLNPSSLWWWTKRAIGVRKRFQSLGRGSFELLNTTNRKVLAFTRSYGNEHMLVVANLSRFAQTVELDLSAFAGTVPIEIFAGTQFPLIREDRYFLSLGSNGFYWFALQPQATAALPEPQSKHPALVVEGKWHNVFSQPQAKAALEAILSDYLPTRRWFSGKARTIQSTQITEAIPLVPDPAPETAGATAYIVLLRVIYSESSSEVYMLPLAYAEESVGSERIGEHYQHGLANLQMQGQNIGGVLYDALADKDFLSLSLAAIAHQHQYQGLAGKLVATATDRVSWLQLNRNELKPSPIKEEQSNSSVVYGNRLILKFFRKLENGINPDLEIGRFLMQKPELKQFAPVVGAWEYHHPSGETMTLAIAQQFVANSIDAWSFTLDCLRNYFERVMVLPEADLHQVKLPSRSLVELLNRKAPSFSYNIIVSYLDTVKLLGQRTAQMHLALATDSENPDFAPEAFSLQHQRSVYQDMRDLTEQVLLLLEKRLETLLPDTQLLAQTILSRQGEIRDRIKALLTQPISATRIRCHGDYRLSQVLFTGKDFVIIDFEGEAARPLAERRTKRSPLRDVAGMLQSFNHALTLAFRNEVANGLIRPDNLPVMEQWAQYWYSWVSATFINAYLATAEDASFIPKTQPELKALLDAYLFEKSIYELGYELNSRPDWVDIPLQRILQLLESSVLSNWEVLEPYSPASATGPITHQSAG
ncbi:maltose alpha-D-glucosyltransferase [Pseudanabaena sp. FACHB-2040]|uniref:maltose alpha-D-glucosyltransferase n=1 Tax=Pseudanabaena sp. FACHB-2040 TaxID=2692859 RepID=UPI0016883B53|nr:maltose alpha-D-glucosyltransferase [Pseudanabaena sp. FACHB-2040]MBD2258312.1 maltose alpha-D-glucosyltransferase [Pseudanabaena sp. FACHB-2040]